MPDLVLKVDTCGVEKALASLKDHIHFAAAVVMNNAARWFARKKAWR